MCVTAAAVVEFPTRQNSLCWSLDEDDFRDGRSQPSKTLTTTSVLAGGLHKPPRTALWNHIELIFIFALFSLTFFSCCVDFTQGTSENIKLFRYTSFFLFSNYLLCFHVYTLFGRFFSLNSCIGPWYKPISRRRREHSFFLHPKGKKKSLSFFFGEPRQTQARNLLSLRYVSLFRKGTSACQPEPKRQTFTKLGVLSSQTGAPHWMVPVVSGGSASLSPDLIKTPTKNSNKNRTFPCSLIYTIS